jgi:lysophospholipase L1-like esterase
MISRRRFVFLAGAAALAQRPIKIAIIGDSTVAEYPEEQPTRGWGHYIPDYFQPNVIFVNLAKNGRSTKTFLSEGLWSKTLAEKPDFILIQFGHNDSHESSKPEATNAATDYKTNLRMFIDEARAVGAKPILITPMHRRTKKDTLQPYADAMKQVATEKRVSLIDLHAMSGKLYAQLGPEGAADLASDSKDQTHFNEKGARAMAKLVMTELPQCDPTLAAAVKP